MQPNQTQAVQLTPAQQARAQKLAEFRGQSLLKQLESQRNAAQSQLADVLAELQTLVSLWNDLEAVLERAQELNDLRKQQAAGEEAAKKAAPKLTDVNQKPDDAPAETPAVPDTPAQQAA
jgi:DNA repair exonuclease SbcCD ATPase subunit